MCYLVTFGVEIGMQGYTASGESGWQFCNLVELNGSISNTPEEFYETNCKDCHSGEESTSKTPIINGIKSSYLKKQLKAFGFSYDWDREIATCKEDYYKWNQYIFLKFFEKKYIFGMILVILLSVFAALAFKEILWLVLK